MAVLSVFTGSLGDRPQVCGDVVVGLRIIALLAKEFLVTCVQKRDGYCVGRFVRVTCALFFLKLLPLIEGFYMGQLLKGY